MTVRLHDTRPEPREDAGRGAGAAGACLFLGFVLVYVALHAVLWIGRVIA